MSRIAITGGPRHGKTTFADDMARRLGCPVLHTDDLIGQLEWSAASAEVARWLDEPGPWIIEGVAVSRALRKYRTLHDDGPPPIGLLVVMTEPFVALTKAQAIMARGVETVTEEILPWLHDHGVGVQYVDGAEMAKLKAEHQVRSGDDT